MFEVALIEWVVHSCQFGKNAERKVNWATSGLIVFSNQIKGEKDESCKKRGMTISEGSRRIVSNH